MRGGYFILVLGAGSVFAIDNNLAKRRAEMTGIR
jgi:hypothetical protein